MYKNEIHKYPLKPLLQQWVLSILSLMYVLLFTHGNQHACRQEPSNS